MAPSLLAAASRLLSGQKAMAFTSAARGSREAAISEVAASRSRHFPSRSVRRSRSRRINSPWEAIQTAAGVSTTA